MITTIVFDFHGVFRIPHTDDIDENMLVFAKKLNQQGFKLYLFSNTPNHSIERINEKYNFKQYFEKVITAEDIGETKPSDESFVELLALINTLPENTLYVDDEGGNNAQAEKFGMNIIQFTNYESFVTALKQFNINI